MYLSHHVQLVEDVFPFSKDNFMQPITSNFQKWSSYSPSFASLCDTPSLVHYSQPPPSSISLSPPTTTSSNVEGILI